MSNDATCKVCGSQASEEHCIDPNKYFYSCPVCGKYEYYVMFGEIVEFDLNHLGAYLTYNGFKEKNDSKFFSTMDESECNRKVEEFNLRKTHRYPVRLIKENVSNWYPKTFAEKIDNIVLYLESKTRYFGEKIQVSKEEIISFLFIDRYTFNRGKWERHTDKDLMLQIKFLGQYLVEQDLIVLPNGWKSNYFNLSITLAPLGYARVDELQKKSNYGKNVLVAMQFGENTLTLRNAIREGINAAGYVAILIDEVEHNEFITPELLKHIRDSRFVVVDLSHQNNGAYFEEGYAMGVGKPVIQLCRKGVSLHFDIAQKNTIIWEHEEEIVGRLRDRINATIE